MAQEFKSLRLIVVMLIRKSSQSQLATLILGSHQTSVLCHMGDFGCGDGGWTPVMKMNGNEVLFHPFYSQSAYDGILPGGLTIFVRKVLPMKECIYNFFSTLTCYIYLVKLILFILCKLLDRSDHCAGK